MAGPVSSIFRQSLFAGKSAIVTGGGTGIGKAITQELLYLGCNVMIASRNVNRLSEAYEQMKQSLEPDSPARLEMIECNIRQEEQVHNLMKETISKFGKIDYMVNNAGGQFPSPAENISKKGFTAVIETNLTGTFVCCREVYNQWMAENGGVIVNIIADMWKGFPNMSHTGAARSGVDNLTKSLSLEWASSGVRVNAVAPGAVNHPSAEANYKQFAQKNLGVDNFLEFIAKRTPFLRPGSVEEGSIASETAVNHYKDWSQARFGTADFFGHFTKIQPLKRPGTVEEISASVLFLLSPAASFISGETLRVDGAHSLYGPSGLFVVPDHDKMPAYNWEEDVKTQEDNDKKSKL